MQNAYTSPHPQRRIVAAGVDMAYVDTGPADAPPVVFLHGNPTSSYLWRNIIPHVSDRYRCLAPDLPGMGNSGPMPDGRYRFIDHRTALDTWFEALGLDSNVTLVVHDWGSALGFDWARRHPDSVAGIAHMEAIVAPRRWDDFPPGRDTLFRRLRSGEGESLVLDDNFFIEVILPKSIIEPLGAADMDVYRAPFPTPGSRLPMLVWPREIPIDGKPEDVAEIVAGYGRFMAETPIRKLFIDAEPGAIVQGRLRDICRAWPRQTEIAVRGIHFVQEDSAEAIGRALADFLG